MNSLQQKIYDKLKTFEIISIYETFETLQDGTKHLGYFDFGLHGQTYKELFTVTNEINVSYSLVTMKDHDSNKLTRSLLNLYKMARYVEKGRINLNLTKDRPKLEELFDCSKKQVEAYDYIFYP